jgi:phospholipid/cholesterol/gamma-HCH transport system substrate-binding protein
VDAFNAGPLLTSQEIYESLLGATTELANTMKDFRTNPKKFLRMKLF